MSGTLKTASFKMRSFPSIPKNFLVEEKSPIKPLASARGRRFFGKFFLILLIVNFILNTHKFVFLKVGKLGRGDLDYMLITLPLSTIIY